MSHITLCLVAKIKPSFFVFQEPTTIPSRKKNEVGVPEVGESEEGVCCKITFV